MGTEGRITGVRPTSTPVNAVYPLVTNGGSRFGTGFDECLVEMPLALRIVRLDTPGDVLDAGVAPSVPVVRELMPRSVAWLVHFMPPGSDEPIWRNDPNVRYEFGDLPALQFPSERFDRIVCVSTLEHVGLDTTRFGARVPGVPESTAVAELLRVLKPGDQILITVPHGCVADRGWYRVLDRVALDALLAPASGHDLSLQFFYYDRGWFEGGANGPDVARYVPPDSDLIVVAIAYLTRARASSGVDAR